MQLSLGFQEASGEVLSAVVPHALGQLEVNLLFGWVQRVAGLAGRTNRAPGLPSLPLFAARSECQRAPWQRALHPALTVPA